MKFHTKRGIARRASLAATAIIAVALLAGCSTPTQGGDTSPSAGAGAVPASVTQAVAAGYKGNSTAPPSSSPKISRGHNVWVISAFQQVSGLAQIAREVQAAATKLGWKSSVCDGQNQPTQWSSCIRQAVAAGADAIVLDAVDCGAVAEPLAQAKAAGVKIAGISAFDCNDPSQGGGKSMFDATVGFTNDIKSTADFYEKTGRLRADWIIDKTDGKAKVLHVAFQGVAIGEYLSKGFTEELSEKCPGCSIVGTVSITPSEIGQLRQKFETGLLQATSANAIAVDLDFMLTAGVEPAIVQAGVGNKVVLGGECVQETLDYIRAGGGVQACVGLSNGRAAWSIVDQLNRVFDGDKTVKDGIGTQIIDATHNLPKAGGPYEGALDYRAVYSKLWSAAG